MNYGMGQIARGIGGGRKFKQDLILEVDQKHFTTRNRIF
jgi:hypothetical protein